MHLKHNLGSIDSKSFLTSSAKSSFHNLNIFKVKNK